MREYSQRSASLWLVEREGRRRWLVVVVVVVVVDEECYQLVPHLSLSLNLNLNQMRPEVKEDDALDPLTL